MFTQNHTFCLELYSLHLAFLAAIDITAFSLETLKVRYDPSETTVVTRDLTVNIHCSSSVVAERGSTGNPDRLASVASRLGDKPQVEALRG